AGLRRPLSGLPRRHAGGIGGGRLRCHEPARLAHVKKVHTREERTMPMITRRRLLAGSAAALALPAFARAQSGAKPRITAISQWSAGSDGAAISALGKLFEDRGGVWQHNPVPGFTTDMMNKLRAQIMAGDPPAISQLKGPEITGGSPAMI